MQGDFTRLNFNVPGRLEQRSDMLRVQSARAVAQVDEARRGAPRAHRRPANPLQPGGCTSSSRQAGRWILVSDATSSSPRARRSLWARAYGEFRVDAQRPRAARRPAWAGSANPSENTTSERRMNAEAQADVVVAGGGLAGIVTALEALRAGQRVILVDRDTPERFGGLAL